MPFTKGFSADSHDFRFRSLDALCIKNRQTVADISMTSEFHDIFDRIFGGFLPFGTTVLRGGQS